MAIIEYKDCKIDVFKYKKEGKFGYGQWSLRINNGESECGYLSRGNALHAGLIRVNDFYKDRFIKCIKLTQGYEAIVDAIDYPWLIQWNWNIGITKNGLAYPQRGTFINYKSINYPIHIEIIKRQNIFIPRDYEIHHKDNNTLNEIRTNLEVLSPSAHKHTRGLKKNSECEMVGVQIRRDRQSAYRVYLNVNGEKKLEKHFNNYIDAIQCRLEAEKQYLKRNQSQFKMEIGSYIDKTLEEIIKTKEGLQYLKEIDCPYDLPLKMRIEFYLKDIGELK